MTGRGCHTAGCQNLTAGVKLSYHSESELIFSLPIAMLEFPPPTRSDRRRQRRRQSLIDAARTVIAGQGIHFTVADVTEAADVGIGSFYTYFRDKEELLEAAVWEDLQQLGDPTAPEVANLPSPERARVLLFQAYAFVDTHRGLMAAVFGEGHLPGHYERGLRMLEERVAHILTRVGHLPESEVPPMAALIAGMMAGGIRYALQHPETSAPDMTARTLRLLQPLSELELSPVPDGQQPDLWHQPTDY